MYFTFIKNVSKVSDMYISYFTHNFLFTYLPTYILTCLLTVGFGYYLLSMSPSPQCHMTPPPPLPYSIILNKPFQYNLPHFK